jgi:hypothetical protein
VAGFPRAAIMTDRDHFFRSLCRELARTTDCRVLINELYFRNADGSVAMVRAARCHTHAASAGRACRRLRLRPRACAFALVC